MHLLYYKPENGQLPLELAPANGSYFDVDPLSHAQLATYAQQEAEFEITFKNARIVGGHAQAAQTYTATMRIASDAREPLYGIVESGWIPFPFMSGDIALVDRNVVSKIERLRRSHERPEGTPVSPQLDLSFAGRLVSPLPYVLEGSLRKMQTLSELRSSLNKANRALRRVLPAAQISPISDSRVVGLYGLLQDKARFQRKAVPFLMDVSPSVAQPAGPRQQVEVERKILDIAKERGIEPTSFVVLAVLSCLYDNVSANIHRKVLKPGRAVVKPKQKYSEGDAYAALSDLLFLELVVAVKAHGLAQRPVFYTHDLGLVAFWSALNPRKFAKSGREGATGEFTLEPSLFPALSKNQCADLLARLQI